MNWLSENWDWIVGLMICAGLLLALHYSVRRYVRSLSPVGRIQLAIEQRRSRIDW